MSRSFALPVRRLIPFLGLLFVTSALPAQAAEDVNITMSFMRYCREHICTSNQFAYVKHSGETSPPAVDNEAGIIDVSPGARVTWFYNDTFCDLQSSPRGRPPGVALCPGHNVVFEDGSLTGPMLRARTYPLDTFSWSVPVAATTGSLIRYYCEPEPGLTGHYEAGMTGILRIVQP